MAAVKPLRIGVMMEEVQLADILGADVLASLSSETVETGFAVFPELLGPLREKAPSMVFFFLGSTLEPAKVTMGLKFVPNTTYDECPRDLDIVLIGGPWLNHRPAAADKFMKEAWKQTPVWLTTCTGSLWLASTGLLDGLKTTTNRAFIPMAKQINPKVEWIEQRWVVESKPYTGESGAKGELWSSGAAGCGIEMIIKYCIDNFSPDLVRVMVLESLELGQDVQTGQFYN